MTGTQGASGAPERIDLAPYRHALTQTPDLLRHLAHIIIKGRYEDNQPKATDLQSAPGRIPPLDQIDQTFAGLWTEAEHWRPYDHRPLGSVEHMVRRARVPFGPHAQHAAPIGPRGVKGTPAGGDVLHAWAMTLTNRIFHVWPTIETLCGPAGTWGQAEADALTRRLDMWLLTPLRQWPMDERAPVPERPHKCELCGQDGIWAEFVNVARGTIVCARCRAVTTPEAWVTIPDAARMLDVTERTIRRWVDAGLPYRKSFAEGRMVELGAARSERDYRAARRTMNLPSRK